jgi:hypothetical protein
MRRVRLALLLAVAVTTGTAFSLAGTSNASPSTVRAAAPTCYQFWQHSGHTARTVWYHCHDTSDPYVKRVHICGESGTLHGITVAQFPDGVWLTNDHRHDPGGEGC